MYTIDYLRSNELLIYECISGSKAYGLALPSSDTDIKGVFIFPKKAYYGLTYTDQVNNESNDIVFYELKKFIELLLKNNPNSLDLLYTPEDCILYKNPVIDLIKPELFLSRLCKTTFAEYAMAQIKKAKGLKKKIRNPVSRERKSILDFCYILDKRNAVSLKEWLNKNRYLQENCGLVKISHTNDIYSLYYDNSGEKNYRGIMPKLKTNEIVLSTVAKEDDEVGLLSFNRSGYSSYCKEYKEYWEWAEKRNDERYENTISHGKNYDAKNMMHVFRLLDMAEEIALYKKVILKRPNRVFLLSIRRGDFMYEDLMEQAEEKIQRVMELYEKSDLPEAPDKNDVEELLVKMRWYLYHENKCI